MFFKMPFKQIHVPVHIYALANLQHTYSHCTKIFARTTEIAIY